MDKWKRQALVCVLWMSIAAHAMAQVAFVKFDDVSDGTWISDQYTSDGVRFVNDYSASSGYRSAPQATASGLAWSSPNILVNESTDDEIQSSYNVPMVVRFDHPIAGIGFRAGRTRGAAPSMRVSLFDAAGALTTSKTLALNGNFNTGTEVWDPTETARLAVFDCGAYSTPEAIDDLAFQPGTGVEPSDDTKPIILITSHLHNATVASTPQLIQGTIYDNSGSLSTVRLNGIDVPVRAESGGTGLPTYRFAVSVPLQPGGNPICAAAWDAAGNHSAHRITLYYGPPSTVSLAEFHMTQRGVLYKKAVDAADPFAAGKFTIVRIRLNVQTAGGAPTYVDGATMSLYRETGGGGETLVNTYSGTTYSPYLTCFDSPSNMAGIHFWVPGEDVATAGNYRVRFQATNDGSNFGPLLNVPGSAWYTFHEMQSIRVMIQSTEGPFFAPENGADHMAQVSRAFHMARRAYPVADDGLSYVLAAPLPIGDGSEAMDAAHDYIKGAGFGWTFIDKHADGIRKPTTVARPDGGWLAHNGSLTGNLPRRVSYGLFRPGNPAQWEMWNGFTKRYHFPVDDNHNGSIDDEMTSYAMTFHDGLTTWRLWSTGSADYNHGETFRGFDDSDGDGNAEKGEPESPYAKRWRNMKDNLLVAPSVAFLDTYNLTAGAMACRHIVQWFPEPFHPDRWDYDMLGGGQGQINGKGIWTRMSELPSNQPADGERRNFSEHILTHEMGHNYGLRDTYYADTPKNKYVIEAWCAYDYYDAALPRTDRAYVGIMHGGSWPRRLHFTDENYLHVFNKLKEMKKAAVAAAGGPTSDSLAVTGRVTPEGEVVIDRSRRVEGGAQTTGVDPSGTYALRLGSGESTLAQYAFTPSERSPMDPSPTLGDTYSLEPGEVESPGRFALVVPLETGLEWFDVSDGEASLARVEKSGSAPGVQLVIPNGGESLAADTPTTIEWTGHDDDSDSLVYTIAFSHDGGTTWWPVADGLTGSTFEWTPYHVPGSSEGMIRVTVCDGFHVASDTSDDVFEVESKPPVVAIVQPTSGSVYLEHAFVPLWAVAFDLEDTDLDVEWRLLPAQVVSGATKLTGGRLEGLGPGVHELVVAVADNDGHTVTSPPVRFTILADTDADGMDDEWEDNHDHDSTNAMDALSDQDNDGLLAFEEAWRGLKPNDDDTDNDGDKDGDEVANGSDPRDPSSRIVRVAPAWQIR